MARDGSGPSVAPGSPTLGSVRLLFVSSTTAGGSGLSQRQLASRLIGLGHEVVLLVDHERDDRRRRLYRRQVNLTTKIRRLPLPDAVLALVLSPLLALQRVFGSHPRRDPTFGVPVWETAMPENALRTILGWYPADVVVASSIDRVTWRRVRAQLRARGIPSVLHLREEVALGHLTVTGAPPDLLLANSETLAAGAHAAGSACEVIPSVVELADAHVESSREVVLFVNPTASHGFAVLLAVAERCPDIAFAVQESWPVGDATWRELQEAVDRLPNVELRAQVTSSSFMFRDASVLFAPHQVDNRPRVVAEAQVNGIPVLASSFPGLVEAVGDGGLLIEPGSSVEDWVEALHEVLADADDDGHLACLARRHAARSDLDPALVTDRFVDAVSRLVDPAGAASSRR